MRLHVRRREDPDDRANGINDLVDEHGLKHGVIYSGLTTAEAICRRYNGGEPYPGDVRLHLAWLLYCYQEGYTKKEDRDILDNWLRDPPWKMTSDDVVLRGRLLQMADEILAELVK